MEHPQEFSDRWARRLAPFSPVAVLTRGLGEGYREAYRIMAMVIAGALFVHPFLRYNDVVEIGIFLGVVAYVGFLTILARKILESPGSGDRQRGTERRSA